MHLTSLEAFAASAPYRITLQRNPADIAISSTGATSWEMLSMQLPFLGVIVAENQRRSGEVLAKEGLCVLLGGCADLEKSAVARQVTDLLRSQELRARLSSGGATRVDGYGCARVIQAMREGADVTSDDPATRCAAGRS